jgi:hypothetical protein
MKAEAAAGRRYSKPKSATAPRVRLALALYIMYIRICMMLMCIYNRLTLCHARDFFRSRAAAERTGAKELVDLWQSKIGCSAEHWSVQFYATIIIIDFISPGVGEHGVLPRAEQCRSNI